MQVMHKNDLAGGRRNTKLFSKQYDSETVADDRSIPVQAQLGYLFIVMAESRLIKSAQRMKLCNANKLPCIDRGFTC
jgi:hypothetical protein